MAGFFSFYASASPDGLEKVAHDKGIDTQEKKHATEGSLLAGYSVKDIGNDRLATGLAGMTGVAVTVGVGSGIFWLVRRRGATAAEATPTAVPQTEKV